MNVFFIFAMVFSVGEASTTPQTLDESDVVYSAGYADLHSLLTVTEKDSKITESVPFEESIQFTNDEHHRALSSKCKNNEQGLKIDIITDAYGFETSWKLLKDTNDGVEKLASGPPDSRNYGRNKRYMGLLCLSPGTYKFVIDDLFKDGMCCSFGEGKYAGYIGTKKIFSSPDGDENWGKRNHTFKVAKSSHIDIPLDMKSSLTARDIEWL
mmetsp:Transcript_19237/g.40573  ORF Transcript_19237/g.40573 Transcript_19237/m.40573 type:complete len:211 (+) Transcript_19237:185-817(+)